MKKLFKIGVLILMMIPSMFFVACKSKVKQISASNVKTDFYYGEDFSLGDVQVKVTYKNKKSDNVDLSDLQLNTAESTYSNSLVIIDFSAYKPENPGSYNILVSYAKDAKINYTYTVTVTEKQFTEADYQVSNYVGEYDGKSHSINVITNIEGASIKYGISETNCSLNELSFRQAGQYTIYFKIEKVGYSSAVTGSGTVTISKKTLVVTPKSKTISFGQPFNTGGFEYTADGFVGTDTKADLDKSVANYSTDYIGEKIGTYEITMSGLVSANYRFEYRTGVLTVEKATNTLQITIPQTQYGTAINPIVNLNPSKLEITYQYSHDGEVWVNGLPEDIGEYFIKASTPDSENYGPASVVIRNVIITKRNLTITARNLSIEYNSEFTFNPDTDVTYEGFINDETKENLVGTLTYTTDYVQGTSNVGEYTIRIGGYSNENSNYNIKYVNGTLTVTPAKNVLVVTIEDITYGQTLSPNVVTNLSGYNVSYKFLSSIEGSNWTSNVLPKNAGTYTIVASTESKGNFTYTECIIENVVINKKELNFTCENSEIKFNQYYVEGNITSANFTGFVDGESMSNLSGVFGYTSDYVRGNDAGTYDIHLTCSYGNNITHTDNGISQNNYKLNVKTGVLTVDKADGSVQAAVNNITYGESFELGKNIVVTNNLSGGAISFAYQTIDNPNYVEGLPTQAGFYNIRVISGETKNYNVSYDDTPRGVEIKKKSLTVTPVNYTVTYNEAIAEDCEYNGVSVEGFIEGEDITNLSLSGDKLFYTTDYVKGSPVKAVGYNLNVSGYTSNNYDIKYNVGKVIVNKATNVIDVTLNPVIYGERPAPTENSNLAKSDDPTLVVTYRYSRDKETWYQTVKNVGEYYVEASTKATTNYNSLRVVLDNKQVINKRTLVITPSTQILKYKQEFDFRKVKYTYDSFAYDESIYNLEGSLSLYSIDYVCDKDNDLYTTAGQDVEFTVSGFEESASYIFDYKPGKITVIQTETNLAVTVMGYNRIESGVTYVTYSGEDLAIDYYNESNSAVITSYQMADSQEDIWTDGLPKNSGEYRIKVISTEVPGKYDSEELTKLVTIEKRNIVVTPIYVELKYNQEFVDNGVKFESTTIGKEAFANGEDSSVLEGNLVITSDYTKGCDANLEDEHYNIYASESTLSGVNYNITYKSGLLRVNKAENTLKPTIVYTNEQNKLYYGQDINIDMVDKESDGQITVEYKVVGAGDITYTTEAPVNRGRYVVRVKQTATRNYNSYTTTINFEISPKVIALAWGNDEFLYDGYSHVPTVEITNLEEGDECEFTLVGAQINAGDYIAYIENLRNSNYALGDNVTKEFIINKVVVYEPTITSVVYNGNVQTANVSNTDNYTVKTNNGGKDAGDYAVELSLIDPVNYKWSTTVLENVTLHFIINKANDNVLYFNDKIITDGDNLDYNFYYNSPVTQMVTSRYGTVETLYKRTYEEYYTNAMPTDCSYYKVIYNEEDGSSIIDKSVLYTSYDVKYIVYDNTSYNTVEYTCKLTINKINPVYTLPEGKNIFADKYFASGYLTELYTLDLPGDISGKWVWENVNDAEYSSEYTGAHYIVPGYMENGEYVDGYVTEVLHFVPLDTTNYNTLDFNIDIYAYNNRKVKFNDDEITIISKDVPYNNEGYSIDVMLSGRAQGAVVKYSEEYDGEYVDTNPVFSAVNDATHFATYTVYVKVYTIVELAKNVNQEVESDILSGTLTITDFISNIIVTSHNYNKAIIKGEQLDISDVEFRAYYNASQPEELTGDQFAIINLNTSTVGEKSVTLRHIASNTTCENIFNVYVYEDFVEGFSFNFSTTDSSNSISTTKISRRRYQAAFSTLEQISFYSNITLMGTIQYNAYVSLLDQTVVIDEGNYSVNYSIGIVVGNGYIDTYTIVFNTYFTEFDYSIVDVSTPKYHYDSVNDKYVFEYVTSDNYGQLSSNYGDIIGLYELGTTEFTEENNLLSNGATPSDIKFADNPTLIVEKSYGVFVYRSVLEFNTIPLPIAEFTIDSVTYTADTNNKTITLKVQPNQDVVVNFGDLDSAYSIEASSSYTEAELSGNNVSYTMSVSAEEMLEGKSYSFLVCHEEGEEHYHLQLINVNLVPIDYINTFTITTDKNNVFNLAENPTISMTNEFITSVDIDVEAGYTYELYVNGELTDIDNVVLLADKAYNYQSSFINNIALKVTDGSGNVSYTEYTAVVYFDNIEVMYNQGDNYADTLFSYHNIITTLENNVLRIVYNENTLTEDTYTLKVNGIVTEFGGDITLDEGINLVEVIIEREDCMPLAIRGYFLGTSDTYKMITDMNDTSVFGSYSIYYKGEYVGTYQAYGYTITLDNYMLNASDFEVKDSANNVLNPTIDLEYTFVTFTIEYQGVNYVTMVKVMFNNIVLDNNNDATLYYIDGSRVYTQLHPDINDSVSIKVKSGDSIFVSVVNPGARVTSDSGNFNYNYLTLIGEPGEIETIHVTVTSSDGTASKVYTITYEIEARNLIKVNYEDTIGSDRELNSYSRIISTGDNVYEGDFTMTYPDDTGVLQLVAFDKLSNYNLYDASGNAYTTGDRYVKVSYYGFYQDMRLYRTVDFNKVLSETFESAVSDPYSSATNALIKLETDVDGNTYYSVYVLMNNVLYKVVVYTISDTDTVTNVEISLNYNDGTGAKSVTTNVIVTDKMIVTSSSREYSRTYFTEIGLSVGKIAIYNSGSYSGNYTGDFYLGNYTQDGYGIYSDAGRANLVAYASYDSSTTGYILTQIYDTALTNALYIGTYDGVPSYKDAYFVPTQFSKPVSVATVSADYFVQHIDTITSVNMSVTVDNNDCVIQKAIANTDGSVTTSIISSYDNFNVTLVDMGNLNYKGALLSITQGGVQHIVFITFG